MSYLYQPSNDSDQASHKPPEASIIRNYSIATVSTRIKCGGLPVVVENNLISLEMPDIHSIWNRCSYPKTFSTKGKKFRYFYFGLSMSTVK